MADRGPDLDQKLAALQDAFRGGLTARMAEIEDAGRAVSRRQSR